MAESGVTSNVLANKIAKLSDVPDDISPALLHNVSLKSKQTGFKYFSEGYIHDVRMYLNDGSISMKCKCHRSMRKNESPHAVFLDVSAGKPGCILSSHCTCQAG